MMATVSRTKDSFYVRDCQQIQTGTVAVQNLTGQISRQLHLAESNQDLMEIQKLIDQAVSECGDIQTLLKRFQEYADVADAGELGRSDSTSRKMMQRSLSDNVSITARVLEDIIANYLELCRERAAQQEKIEKDKRNVSASSSTSLPEGQQQILQQEIAQMQVVEAFDELHSLRQDSINKVESDMMALKKIYEDLSLTTEHHQDMFDSIEASLLESGQHTQAAVDQFLIAEERVGAAYRRKYKVSAAVMASLLFFYVIAFVAP